MDSSNSIFSELFFGQDDALYGLQRWPAALVNAYVEAQTLSSTTMVLLPDATATVPVARLYQAGCKVLVSNQNPLPLLLAEAHLTHIATDTLQDHFIQLGNLLKAGQPLHQQLDALYQTACPHCAATVNADYFIWHRDLADPQEKYLRCETCGFAGAAAINSDDLNRLDQIETRGVHYHFLIGRTVSPTLPDDDPLRAKFEALYDLYTPRALYAIAEIIMKLDAMILDKTVQHLFRAILYRCLLLASSLHHDPLITHLPEQLRVPNQFIERNVWRLFEAAVLAWQVPSRKTRISRRMDDFVRSHQNSVHFFADTERQLSRYLTAETVSLVMTAPRDPAPTQWVLACLWGGWLMGLKAAEASYALLQQAWPDWVWYQQVLQNQLQTLKPSLKPDARWLFAFEPAHQLQPGAIILAARQVGYEVDSWEIAGDDHEIVLRPTSSPVPPDDLAEDIEAAVRQEAHDAISVRVQRSTQMPSDTALSWSAWQSLLYSGLLAQVVEQLPAEQALTWVDAQISSQLPSSG